MEYQSKNTDSKMIPLNDRMVSLVDWVHNSVVGETLEVVHITDCETTVLGLKDTKGSEVFIIGNMHDLTFILKGNEKR